MTLSSVLPPHDVAGARDLWRIRAWRYAFPAAVISRLGDVVFDLTIVLWISTGIARDQSWAPVAVSGVLIAAALPILLVGPVAGVFADRHDRHRLLLLSNAIQAVAIGSLLVIPLLGDGLGIGLQLVWIYAAIFVSNAAGQFFQQSRLAMIAKTIPDEQRTRAYSAQGSASSLISLIGPPLAAPLLFSVGVGWALGLNALTFVISSMLLRIVSWDSAPEPVNAEESFLDSLRGGLHAVRSNQVLLAITVAVTVATLGVGAITVLEVFFVQEVLQVNAAMLGIIAMFFAAGTLIGVAVAPRLERRFDAARLFVWGLVLMGVLLMVFSRMVDFYAAAVLFFLAAIPVGVINTVLMPLAIRVIPPAYLGRATVTLTVFPTIASLVAMAAAGWLVSTVLADLDIEALGMQFGPIDTIFLLSGLVIAMTGLLVAGPIQRAQAAPAPPARQGEI